jgi:hypothetical protein
VTFTAGGGTQYEFFIGTTSVQAKSADNTYATTTLTHNQVVTVVVTNANGCVATSDGITTTVNALPIPTLSSSDANNTICVGDQVIFTAGGGGAGANYEFFVGTTSVQNGSSTQYTTTSLTNNQTVSVRITNSNGCIATSGGITTVVNALPIPTLSSSDADNSICEGDAVIFTAGGGVLYEFFIGTTSVQAESNDNTYNTTALTHNQVVTVRVTNASGCVAMSSGITTAVNSLPVFTSPATSPTSLTSTNYSDPITPMTVVVTDGDNSGSQLSITQSYRLGSGSWVSGLPSGLTLTAQTPDIDSKSWILAGNANVAAGTYEIKLQASDGTCSSTIRILSLTVNRETATIEYSGLQYFSTASTTSNTAKITLQATAKDPDGVGNLIDYSKVDFRKGPSYSDVNSYVGSLNRTLGYIVANDKSQGVASTEPLTYILTQGEMTAMGTCHTVYPMLNGTHYTGVGLPSVITITVPGADNVSGGGYINMVAPSGYYGNGASGKTNFGFTMKYNKSGSNLQGQANIIFRKGGVNYQIKSNAINSLNVSNYPATGTATGRIASFSTKANLTNLTTGQSLGGNLNLAVQAVQSTITGQPDMILITLTDGAGGLLYSSNWNGTKSTLQALGSGKINVRGVTTSTCCTTTKSVVEETPVELTSPIRQFKVNVYPNPSTSYFTLDVQSSSNDPVEVKMFDVRGYMVYYHKGSLKEAHHKFGQMLTNGTYILDVRQGTNRKTITVLKK